MSSTDQMTTTSTSAAYSHIFLTLQTYTIMMNNTPGSISMRHLPEELLLLIWDYLGINDATPPSVAKFDDEPTCTLTRCKNTPLKNLSLVCKRWRNLLLPSLFSYSRVILSPVMHWIGLSPRLLQLCEARHLTSNPQASQRELDIVQQMRRLFWRKSTDDGQHRRVAIMEYISGDDKLLLRIAKESLHWIPSAKGEIHDYLHFIRGNDLASSVRSFTLSCDQPFNEEGPAYSRAEREGPAIWKTLFKTIDPLRVVIASHPTVMALLTESRLGVHQDWLFKQDVHYLELSRDADDDDVETQNASPFQPALHNIRKWTHLGYNENSSIPAYEQYEYFHYSAPAVLKHLILWISKEKDYRMGTQLQSIKYVACFPLAEHVSDVLDIVGDLDSVQVLETRLSPDPTSDLLDDARVGRSDRKDCWQEWNRCYRNILKYIEKMDAEKRDVMLKVSDYENTALIEDLDEILRHSRWVKEDDTWKRP